jgi:RNA polymerase sigma-70 factor (ECF subfamily)
MGRDAGSRAERGRGRLSHLPEGDPALCTGNRAAAGAEREAAEDIVQDALLTIHRVRHTYTPGRPVRPWLAAIVSRRAIDAARRGGRIGARETHNPAAYETFADESANRSEDAAQSADEVGRMMDRLTPRQKEAVELVKLKEMSLADASAASGQSVGALKVNVHRAIQRLRRGLLGDGGEGPR